MEIVSPNFKNNEKIPIRFTGDGKNINPGLIIRDVPKNSQSLALIIEDLDAPAGIWVHWIVFNISPNTKIIKEDSIPGIQGKNTYGRNNYLGPKPPSGSHRYFFRLYALNSSLNLKEGCSKEELEQAMGQHIIEQAELIGLYR
jgi:Raf kinase inhibitor-like YbhB/YbcL family protein